MVAVCPVIEPTATVTVPSAMLTVLASLSVIEIVGRIVSGTNSLLVPLNMAALERRLVPESL